MIAGQVETARTLAAVFGIDEAEALSLLDVEIALTDDGSAAAQRLAVHISRLLGRTIGRDVRSAAAPSVEIVLGTALPRSTGTVVRVAQAREAIEIGRRAIGSGLGEISEPGLVVLACYAAAAAVRVALGDTFRLAYTDPVRVDAREFVVPSTPVAVGKVYLAGAGAIGHGFLYGLAGMQVTGELHVVDPKVVTVGNLNRCMWLEPGDVGVAKAVALATRASQGVGGLRLVPRVGDLSRLPEKSAGAWLEKLVVGVDSRRVRRRLQQELPRDVFDASTTGIEEIVLHFNSRLEPACLACVYHEDQIEHAHEQHVAEVLGVRLEEVRQHLITASAASRIRVRHPQLEHEDLENRAYDSLFKALCGAAQIGVHEGRTVLAPMSFVSVLAGVHLAMEFVRRSASGRMTTPYSSWRLSPWASPVPELRDMTRRRPGCTCCGRRELRDAAEALWNG